MYHPAIEDMFDSCSDEDSDSEESDQTNFESWKSFPQKKKDNTVKCLRMLAINNICNNIDYWMEFIPDNAFKYLYIISPFDRIRSIDTKSILTKLVATKKFQYRHLNLIYHQNLTEMDFGMLSRFNLTDIHLNTLLNRCKKIRRLKIPSKSNFSCSSINRLPVVYPNMDELLVYTYALDHQFINTLSKNCASLKSLHVTATSMFNSKTCGAITLCPTLTSLSLHGVEKMTAKETWAILGELPQLSRLSLHQSTMKFTTLDVASNRLPNITGLDLSACSLSDRGVFKIVTLMQNVVDLNLSNCVYLTSLAFTYIARLEYVELLRICHLSYCCEFDVNVESCLVKIGHRLTLLDLSGLRNVKTDVIGLCCPKLSELYLNDCIMSPFKWIWRSMAGVETERCLSLIGACSLLTKLSMGTVKCHFGDDNYMETLHKLFAGSNNNSLKHLKISSDDFGGLFFKLLFKTVEWQHLETLDLSGNQKGGGVSKKVIVTAIQHCPKLSKLCVRNCNLYTAEKKVLKEMIERSNVDIIVDFAG